MSLKRGGTPWFAAQVAALVLAAGAARAAGPVPVVGGPCEGCEAVFDHMPERIASVARIAPGSEPGEPLHITGTVRDARGRPVAGVIVYAYHTNAEGRYPHGPESWSPAARRHGLLRGWARTDSLGRYAFDTIRPASYPHTTIPQHVHMHVIEPGRCTYSIGDLLFGDDPLLTPERRRSMERARGGPGVAAPVRGDDGVWRVIRDIVLGANVPGYPPRSAAR